MTKRKQKSVEKEGRKTNHYLYEGAGQEALMSALDDEWPGPIPHTVLVAPAGEVIWRHNGKIDPAVAISVIVEAMTPYYQPPAPSAQE